MNKEDTNSSKPNAFIRGIETYIEEIKDISNIDFLKNDTTKLENYYKMGMKYYAESQIPMIEMAYYSIKKTLENIDIKPEEIDILLYISESSIVKERINSTDAQSLLNYLGLNKAYAIGASLSDCANVLLGLQIAESMIVSGQAKNIILVSTNKAHPSPNSRKMSPEVAVSSDAAVSMLVSSVAGGYRLLGTTLTKNEPTPDDAPPLDLSIKKIKGLRIATKNLLSKLNLTTDEIDKVFNSNYSDLSQIFVESCGFEPEKGFYENLAKYSHCLAGDVLITLKDQNDFINLEEHILLISDGPFGSYATCLQKI